MTYTPGIPDPGNFISQSQPLIKSNFTVANTAFGTDHTAFDVVPNQGKHKKVTLIDQGATPVADAAGPIVFSRTVAYPSGPTNRIEEFTRMATGDGSTLVALTGFFNAPITAAAGSSFLPGIPTVVGPNLTSGAAVIKWGVDSTIGGAGVAFASAFPTACFGVVVTGTSTLYTGGFVVTALTTTGFVCNRTSGAGNTGFFYIAIGN